MNTISKVLLGVSMATAACGCLVAQDMSMSAPAMSGPPKVLEIEREYLKPGKAGMLHDKSESSFVQAMSKAKWPTHYVALNSLSGKSRAIYLIGYDSFADWQKDNDAMEKNPTLGAEVDRLEQSDGELLSDVDQAVFYYQPDMSLNADGSLAHVKYMEVTSFHLHPGHHKDWSDLVKLAVDGNKKGGTQSTWAMYELEYGGSEEYVLFSADKGLGDIDAGFADGKKFRDAMGEDGMAKMDELAAKCIESSDSELFAINPKQSYAPEDWVKANPEFWKPKPAMAAKPAADKMKPMAAMKTAGQ